MKVGDKQVGSPQVQYRATKAAIEALTGIQQGAIAYATDTDQLGTYSGSVWAWMADTGEVVSDHGALTGLTDQDHPASAISVTTTGFAGELSAADDTVQKALDTLDDHTHPDPATPDAGDISTDTANFDNNLSVADDTVQKALETLDGLVAVGTADGISVVVDNFDNNLSSADDTVQKALETLDDLAVSGEASGISADTTNFDNNLSAADDTVQKALNTLDDLIAAVGGYYEPVTTGDVDAPELVFADGDVIMAGPYMG